MTSLETFGNVSQIAGTVNQAIGGFFEAEAQRGELKSQALSFDFQKSIANINARAAEQDAHAFIEAGRRQRALSTLRAGQVAGDTRAAQAASGIQAGVGSAAEVRTSQEFTKELDAFAIDANAFRQASAARRRAVDLRNQAQLARVSAENVRGLRRSISPALAAGTTLLSGSADVARSFASNS